MQRLGTLGLFHEPVDLSKVVLESRKLRYRIQYFDPPGYHDARLEEPLRPETLKYWAGLLRKAGIQAPPTRAGITRGEFIRSIELPAGCSN